MQALIFIIAAAFSLSLVIAAPGSAAAAPPTTSDYGRIAERDDSDAGAPDRLAYICEFGRRSKRDPAPAAACAVAYEHARAVGRNDDALRYASTGCKIRRDARSCRYVASRERTAGADLR